MRRPSSEERASLLEPEPESHSVLLGEDGDVMNEQGDPAVCRALVALAASAGGETHFAKALEGGLVAHGRRKSGFTMVMATHWSYAEGSAELLMDRVLDFSTQLPKQEPAWWIQTPRSGDGGASGAPAQISASRRRAN
jgi:hypothetical protein